MRVRQLCAIGLCAALNGAAAGGCAQQEPRADPPPTAAVAAEQSHPRQRTLSLPGGVTLEMILIPAGTFVMGSPDGEPGRDSDEISHEVSITRPFYIGTHEVTQRQWRVVMDNNPSFFPDDPSRPVDSVTWGDCTQFCQRLAQHTGLPLRLPTEAEWEYACRAGTLGPYHVGAELMATHANFDTTEGGVAGGEYLETTAAVGSYPPNAWGLYDMHGNVREWCSDWFGPYQAGGVTVDPIGPTAGTEHVLRGGSWDDYARRCRSAYRHGYRPGDREQCNGLRVAFTPP